VPWGEIAAGSVIATLPVVLLAVFFQRRVLDGLTAGALKG
jgi:multiple sugar transport system permease protein